MLTQLNHVKENRQFQVNYKPTKEPTLNLELTSEKAPSFVLSVKNLVKNTNLAP